MPSIIKKTYCKRCGKEVPLIGGGQKISGGYVCTSCKKKLQPYLEKRRLPFPELTFEMIEEIDAEIAADEEAKRIKEKEQNKQLFIIMGVLILILIIMSAFSPKKPTDAETEINTREDNTEIETVDNTEKKEEIKEEEQQEKPKEEIVEEKETDTPSASSIEEPITIDNNDDFKKLISIENPSEEEQIRSFANKYEGMDVEFNGCALYTEGDRIVVWYGDCEGEDDYVHDGPEMLLMNVVPNPIETGENIHIVATVKPYNEKSWMMYLDNISVTQR